MQLTALTAEAKSLRPDLLVCVDHEGGRVQRFRSDGFTALPPMRALSRRTSPLRGVKSPAMVFSSVDLPAPLGPMIATISPVSTRRSTPRRIS